MAQQLRSGITTGACAAAAAKAAVLAWRGMFPETVEVISPQGRVITVPVAEAAAAAEGGRASVVKDAGDDPDITNGVTIWASVKIDPSLSEIVLQAGEGVGIVTKPGLAVPVGQPAINPGPRTMIIRAVRDVLPECGAVVTISVPGGEQLAARTLNPYLGVVGGLSIIGTTGIVEPMSEEAFKNSLTPQISVVKALGYDSIVFVPGKMGQEYAVKRYGLPGDAVVQTSNFIGHMLESAVSHGLKQVLLIGHLGKIVKVAAGIFHTHNRVADGRLETIAAYLAAGGAPVSVIREILACNTAEAAVTIIENGGFTSVYQVLAERASTRAQRYVFGELTVGTVILTLKGEMLGLDNNARKIGGDLGWNIK
ncbi:cobalamin biosynthesis protein CbiD [Thermosinus carboxydivorans Nor1]|uniref:Cobalt-precorrin-5B C(1)-methyltransferase n=1 Tax=Thermosinus carboxydivorans Nor1 TaxID=401526 RepID=A1HPX8_9FIRM|nr:cobalt-precorrin-5B (C(1))-methyltransferase CbiD [Thermosinus carboxydivorans]EAX47830.1 cobalamin biosynthesis protein CbiD [Thermosinus carboxydivorans Nor1]